MLNLWNVKNYGYLTEKKINLNWTFLDYILHWWDSIIWMVNMWNVRTWSETKNNLDWADEEYVTKINMKNFHPCIPCTLCNLCTLCTKLMEQNDEFKEYVLISKKYSMYICYEFLWMDIKMKLWNLFFANL